MSDKSARDRDSNIRLGEIIHGDCTEVLASRRFSAVDLVHTSPPYNIDKPYEEYTDKLHLDEYLDFISRVADVLSRTLRLGGSLFWQTGYTQAAPNSDEINPIDMLTFPLFKKHGFYLKDRIIWRYRGGMSFKSKFKNQHETVLWFVRGEPDDPKHLPYFDVDSVREKSREHDARNNLLGRNPGNVWEVDRVAHGSIEQTSHIAVFPEEITERIVRACSKPGDLVLDPFLGSGTTAKVARSLGRQYVGIELSGAYYEESLKRVGYQQFGELDTVFSEMLKSFIESSGNRATTTDCLFFFKQLLAGRQTEIETKMSAWCENFSSVDDVEKKEKPSLWKMGEEFLDALPTIVTAETGLLSNVAAAYLSCYKLSKHFNGLRIALIAYRIRLQLSPLLSDSKLDETIKRIVSSEMSSYEVASEGREILLKQARRRIKQNGRRRQTDPVSETEPALF